MNAAEITVHWLGASQRRDIRRPLRQLRRVKSFRVLGLITEDRGRLEWTELGRKVRLLVGVR